MTKLPLIDSITRLFRRLIRFRKFIFGRARNVRDSTRAARYARQYFRFSRFLAERITAPASNFLAERYIRNTKK